MREECMALTIKLLDLEIQEKHTITLLTSANNNNKLSRSKFSNTFDQNEEK